jgi:hypothetical protein
MIASTTIVPNRITVYPAWRFCSLDLITDDIEAQIWERHFGPRRQDMHTVHLFCKGA